jgi:hypothetical protein
MKTQKKGPVLSVYDSVFTGWEQWYLLVSDVHHDSALCNRDLELTHLKKAKDKNARILYFGDFFDAMQGRFDPRRSMEELRPEYRRNNYYDLLVQDAAKFLSPFASNILIFGQGNHETSVIKNTGTDLLNRLVYELNQTTGSHIEMGGYGGWIRFMISTHTGVPHASLKMKYFHGAGAEAPVTRGVIQTNRQAVYLPDADIVVNGHNHQSYYVPISRERLSNKGNPYFDIQHHIRIPGYKQEYADGSGGWNVEKGGVPKPIGAVWMRMFYENERIQVQFQPDLQGADAISPIDCGFSGPTRKRYSEDSEES